jgi:hypothetical protein
VCIKIVVFFWNSIKIQQIIFGKITLLEMRKKSSFSKIGGKTPGSPITAFGDDERNSLLNRHSGMLLAGIQKTQNNYLPPLLEKLQRKKVTIYNNMINLMLTCRVKAMTPFWLRRYSFFLLSYLLSIPSIIYSIRESNNSK